MSYRSAVFSGVIRNRLRDWRKGNHPGLRDYEEQVFLFTHHFAVDWTNNVFERGAKAAERPRQSLATGIRSPPSPTGAASAATSIRPPLTASPHWKPSTRSSRGKPWRPHSSRGLTPIHGTRG